MNNTNRILSLTLGLLLCLAGPLAAQQDDGPLDPNVSGRNAELNQAFSGVAAQVLPNVVALERKSHQGYGVVIEGGYVLTAASVVESQGSYVARGEGFSLTADVVGRDQQNGVALLKLRGDGPAGLTFGSAEALVIGQFVVTVGVDASPLAVGVVSAKDRRVEVAEAGKNVLMGLFSDGNEGHTRAYPTVLHHDGPVLPDHFGAPLVDGGGKLVGINVAAPYRGSSHAITVEQIQPLLSQLKAGTPEQSEVEPAPRRPQPQAEAPSADRPHLGVTVVPAQAEGLHGVYSYGLEVTGVDAGGPAAEAGLQTGDVIVTIQGQPFSSADEFAGTLTGLKPGDQVQLGTIRASKLNQATITLGRKP